MKFEQLLTLFQETHRELQQRAARSVDIALVIRNWLFGWYIVEFEQGGADRAELYGKRLINVLRRNLPPGWVGDSPSAPWNSIAGSTIVIQRLRRQCLRNLWSAVLAGKRFVRHCLANLLIPFREIWGHHTGFRK